MIQTGAHDLKVLAPITTWLTRQGFDVAGLNRHNGTIEVLTTQEGVAFLKSKGLKGHTYQEMFGRAPFGPDPRFLNSTTVEAKLKALANQYPKLTRLQQIGTSLQGRAIWALLISDTPAVNDVTGLSKPSLVFDGVHHAREIMTAEVVMDVADTLLGKSSTDTHIQNIVHNWQVWIVPMLNVDGSNIVFSKDSMWRKNAHADQNNIYGVDINRNYDYKWAGCNGSSSDLSAQDYHGAAAASEPETKAMQNFMTSLQPTSSLSYHSFSELILYPYGCRMVTPENALVQKIAGELAALLPTDDGTDHYAPGTPWELLYDVDGSSMDYFYAKFGTLSYVFEVNQEFQPNFSLRDPTVAKHRNAWLYFIDRMSSNMLTISVIDKNTQKPIAAVINFDTIAHSQGEADWMTNSIGKYFKVLDPGHYNVTATLSDGRKATVSVDMQGKPADLNISL
jgi:carboxypeptidase T